MRSKHFLGVVFSTALLVTASSEPILAQAPGGAAAQSQTQTTRPTTNTQTPGTNPMDTANSTSSSKMDDKKFLMEAAQGGMTEVELGKLAAQKASNDGIKQFGQKMVDDHGKANDQLKDVAGKESVQVPDSLDSKHQARVDKLSKLSGSGFDKAYLKDQLKDHQMDVRQFTAESQSGSDPNIKAFAASVLPTLQQHLEMVKGLNKSEK